MEYGLNLIILFVLECENLSFAVHDEPERYRLHSSRRELRLDLSPEDWRELESYESVEHAAGLLRIDQTHVDFTWILDSVKKGRLGDFVECDSSCMFLLQAERFEKMP